MTTEEIDFEKSFARLEEILNRMNSGKVTLDESLKLYEEADSMIGNCSARLESAQTRIEILMKKRNGELEVDSQGQPIVQDFGHP